LPAIYQIKDWYLDYIEFQKLNTKRTNNPIHGQINWTDSSLKMNCRWLISTWRNVQHP
jgi:hypothetical protein